MARSSVDLDKSRLYLLIYVPSRCIELNSLFTWWMVGHVCESDWQPHSDNMGSRADRIGTIPNPSQPFGGHNASNNDNSTDDAAHNGRMDCDGNTQHWRHGTTVPNREPIVIAVN